MPTILLCMLLSLALPLVASSAATDTKTHAAASSSAAATPARQTPTAPLPKRTPLPAGPQKKVPQRLLWRAHDIPQTIKNLIENPGAEYYGYVSAIGYLKRNPEYISAVSRDNGSSLLELAIREVPTARNLSFSEPVYPNIDVVRYIISQNPRLPSRGIDEFTMIVQQAALRSHLLTQENADVITAMVDLMIGHGVGGEEIDTIIEPRLKKVESLIKDVEARLAALKNNPSASRSVGHHLNGLQKQRTILLKALNRAAEYEAAEAQGPLSEAGLPPELIGIVREYRVGGSEQKQKAAEGEDTDTTGTTGK